MPDGPRHLTLNGKHFGLEQLKSQPKRIDWPGYSAYETAVLQFCRDWLAGQSTFTLHTSGSTGHPKAITLSRNQMQASARLTGQALDLRRGDRTLVCLPVQYIAGLMMLVRGFELGLALTIIEPQSNPLASFPAETHFDFTAFVPLQLQQILTDTPDRIPILNRMKAILVGGAPLSLVLQQQLQRIEAPIYHTYGMTETVTHVALRRLNGPAASAYFRPLPGVRLGQDERGCLTIEAAVTGGRRLRTNDLVELRPDGRFRWLGRSDNVINSGGVKVQIEQVEGALERVFVDYQDGMFAGRRFVVGPVADERLGQKVVAMIEGPPFSAETEGSIRAELLKRLDKYKVPRQFYFVARLLETPTGKIDRQANLAIAPSSEQEL